MSSKRRGLGGYYLSSYGIAVKNGFEGTEEEWLETLKGEQGIQGETGRGIESVEMTQDGRLVFDMTDGTQEEAEESVYGTMEALAERAEDAAEAAEAAADAAEDAAATLTLDDTLTIQGRAADAKATGKALTVLRSVIMQTVPSSQGLWTVGTLTSGSGAESDSTFRMRTPYIDPAICRVSVSDESVYSLSVYAYQGASYIGVWNGETFEKALPTPPNTKPVYISSLPKTYRYRLVVSHLDNTANISTEECENVFFDYAVDASLSEQGIAAEAKATGDAARNIAVLSKWLLEQDFTEQLNHPVFSAGLITNSGVNQATPRTAGGKAQYLRSDYIKISGVVVVTVDDPSLKVAVYGYRLSGVDYALGTHTGDTSKPNGIYIYPISPILCVPYAREAYIRVSLYKDTGFDAENNDYSAFGNSVTISVLPYNALNHYHTPDQYRAIETMKKVLSTFIPLKNFRGTTESPVFVAGGTYAGIYYQAVQNRSRDALFNFSPETFFSMWNNPDSLIYQDDDRGKAYTGVVCSSFASWMTGQTINYTTWDMVKLIDYKNVNDISDIEIGDVLICQHLLDSGSSDHVMVVTNIFATADKITSVEISEGWSPLTRQIIYSKSRFMGLLDGTTRSGDIYHVGRMPNTKPKTLAPFTINTDIISERGDNTYFDLSEDHIYVQSSQDSFSVKSPSGAITTVNFSALTPKSGTEMRDMKLVLNSVGKWTLYGANDEESHLTIIDKGTAALENDTVTLSGYQGCTPSWFLVVGVYRAESPTVSGFDSHVPGHNAGRLVVHSKNDPRYAMLITGDTFTINSSEINTTKNMAYYVRIFYDTGCGQAWQDTNLQYLSESGGGGGDDDQGDDEGEPSVDDNT